ncbi:MAG: SurA N-terminal domain-containing protein [Candidatus Latescibacterota bacterium]
MMRQLRQNTKIILWIVVISFVTTIFAVWGMDLKTGSPGQDPNVLGKVNGEPIMRMQYRAAYEQLTAEVRNMSPDGQLSFAQLELIQNQAWENLVVSMLTAQQIEKLGIQVTDEEILNYLRTTPPPEVQRYFMDEEGNFNYQAYQKALNDPQADWTSMENLARQRIPLIKLNQYLGAQVHVSETEIRQLFEQEHARLTCRYISFPYAEESAEGYAPSNEEIQSYYDKNIEDYTESEKASLEIVKIDISPSAADRQDVLYTMGIISGQVSGGEDFSALAETYSEAASAANGGATGWIGTKERPAQIIEALAALQDGELSKPVEMDDGYYLLKRLHERSAGDSGSEFEALEIFIRLAPRSATIDSLLVLADNLHERAQAVGLQKAAQEMSFEVAAPGPLTKGFPVEGLGFLPGIDEFAFSAKPGDLSKVMRDETRYYLCQLKSRSKQAAKPLADVRDSVVRALTFQRSKQMAWQKADALYKDMDQLGFEEAAQKHQREIAQPDTFRVNENLAGMGPNSRLAKTVLSMQTGHISPPIETRNSYIIAQLLSKTPADEAAFQKNAQAISNRIVQEKLQSYITHWYEKLKENSNIEDYRDQL